MEPREQSSSNQVRIVRLQGNGTRHNRPEPHLTHEKPHHVFNYAEVTHMPDEEDTQESA
ncbi:hypothetical protein [Polyangium mundeleinium]|uniref:Uncharacterized protein n=1 Tax=Polyangium mundeleinium TaxID=2995306 RepID=A0ABT5EWD6_9BACT|nr:hypothetical protein [Polyangium mundeleinium]MDC0746134.1 hypothetical protein [Polyangium mundeleinium]